MTLEETGADQHVGKARRLNQGQFHTCIASDLIDHWQCMYLPHTQSLDCLLRWRETSCIVSLRPLIYYCKSDVHSMLLPSRSMRMMKQALSERKEEPDQRCQQTDQAYVWRNEKRRIAIICGSLLAMTLAFVLFLFTKNIFPVFLTTGLTFLGYQQLDTSLGKSERVQEKHHM